MAVEDKYANSNVAAGKKGATGRAVPGQPLVLVETLEVAAADSDGSIYRFFKGLSANLIPMRITIMCDAITAGTDYDAGLYKTDLGAVINKECLGAALDLSSASKVLDGLNAVVIENRGKKLWELAGHTDANKLSAYDLALTANTVGSAAGTITVIAEFIQG
jgi:hypothetical protein